MPRHPRGSYLPGKLVSQSHFRQSVLLASTAATNGSEQAKQTLYRLADSVANKKPLLEYEIVKCLEGFAKARIKHDKMYRELDRKINLCSDTLTVGQLQSCFLNLVLVKQRPSQPEIFTTILSRFIIEEAKNSIRHCITPRLSALSERTVWCYDRLRYSEGAVLIKELVQLDDHQLNIQILQTGISNSSINSDTATKLTSSLMNSDYCNSTIDLPRVSHSIAFLYNKSNHTTQSNIIKLLNTIIVHCSKPKQVSLLYAKNCTRLVDAVSLLCKRWDTVASFDCLNVLISKILINGNDMHAEKTFLALVRMRVHRSVLYINQIVSSGDTAGIQLVVTKLGVKTICKLPTTRPKLLWGLAKMKFDVTAAEVESMLSTRTGDQDVTYLTWAIIHGGDQNQADTCLNNLSKLIQTNAIKLSGQLLHAYLAMCKRFLITLDESMLLCIGSFKNCFLSTIQLKSVKQLLCSLDVPVELQNRVLKKKIDRESMPASPVAVNTLKGELSDLSSQAITSTVLQITSMNDTEKSAKASITVIQSVFHFQKELNLDELAMCSLCELYLHLEGLPENSFSQHVTEALKRLTIVLYGLVTRNPNTNFTVRQIPTLIQSIGINEKTSSIIFKTLQNQVKKHSIDNNINRNDMEQFAKDSTTVFCLIGSKIKTKISNQNISTIRDLGMISLSHNKSLRKDSRLIVAMIVSVDNMYPLGVKTDILTDEICKQIPPLIKERRSIQKLTWMTWLYKITNIFKSRNWIVPRAVVSTLKPVLNLYLEGIKTSDNTKDHVLALDAIIFLKKENFVQDVSLPILKSFLTLKMIEEKEPSDVFLLFPDLIQPPMCIRYIRKYVSKSSEKLTQIIQEILNCEKSSPLNAVVEHIILSYDVNTTDVGLLRTRYSGRSEIVIEMLKDN